jgi:hypothetical protein
MRGAYRVLAGLIALGVLVQAAAIAGGWFGTINEIDDGATINEDYEGNLGHAVHGMNGMMIMSLLGLFLFVLSFFAKSIPGAVKLAGLTFLAIVVQIVLAFIAFGVPAIGILHGVNAFVIFGLALMCVRRATTTSVADTTAPAPEAPASV